jgi:hypothetical protein
MAEVVDKMLKELKARRKELEPLVAEYHQVESAIRAFEQSDGGAPSSPRGATRKAPTRRSRRGRPRKGEPTRSDQFLALVKEQPGITVSQAAKHLNVQPNYLYRVSAGLVDQGTISKDGHGFAPAKASGRKAQKADKAAA